MSSRQVIENKISSVKKYLTILQRYKKYKKEDIARDIDLRGAIERYLYLLVQAVIDLAEGVIAYKEFRKPTTMSESFDILHEEEIISAKLTDALVKMVGFRNILAHDYEKIDYGIVYHLLQERRRDIEIFLQKIGAIL